MVSPAPNAASWRAMPPPPPPPGPPPSRKAGSSSSLLRRKPTTVISVGAPPPPPPPPPRKDTIEPRMRSPTKSAEQIMRERRRAAHAMYESNEMVEIAGVSTTSTATGSTNSDTDGKNLSDAAVENGENNNNHNNNSTIGSNSNNPANSKTDSISTKPENENKKRSKQRMSSKASSSSSSAAAAASSSATSTATSPKRKSSSSKKPTTPTRRGKKNSAAASPDKQPKRGFFKKILGRNRSSPRNKQQQQQPAPKSPSRRGSRRGGAGINTSKKNPNRSASPKLGRPQDAKPGDSYMSTPHSAEIIVRRDVAAAAKTEEEEEAVVVEQQHKVETEDMATKNLMGTPTRPQVRTREEGKSPHHNMQIMESFSSPKFEDITVNHTFQTDDGGDQHDDNNDDLEEEDEADMGDDVSAVTDPTFQNNQERRPERRSPMNPLLEEDPFSSFWTGGGGRQQQVDPFEDPFFKAQAGFEKQASYQPHKVVYDGDTGERYTVVGPSTLQHANDHHIIATSSESVDVSGLSMGSPGKPRRPQVSPVADPPLTYFHDDDDDEEDDFELESGMGEEQDESEVHREADLETAAQVEDDNNDDDEDDAPDPPLELLDDSGLMDDSLQTDDSQTLEDEGARDPPEKENKSPEAGGKNNNNNNNNNKDDPPVDPLEEEMMQHFFRRGARSEDETARPMYEIRSVPSDPTFMRKGLPHSDELFIRTAPSLEPPPSKRRAPEPKDLRPPTPPEPRRMPHTHTMPPPARAETTKTLRTPSTPPPPPPPPATDKSPATHKALKFMRVGRDTVRSNRARSFTNLESNEAPADELASRDAELSSSSSSFEPRGFLSKFAKQGQSRRGVEPESSAEPKLEPEPIREQPPPQPSWKPVEERLAPTGATSSGYLSKFSKQGRRPRPLEKEPLVLQTRSGLLPIVPRPGLERKPHRKPPAPQQPETITKARATTIPSEPLTIDSARVEIGMICKRIRRAELLEKGLAAPVVLPLPRKPAEPPQEQPHVDISRMDPIQRAGYRLLSKAAVPIQSAMRRYLAEREAVDRMWALIELQSYFRRWRAEAFVQAHIWSATKIQATFRSWKARDLMEEANYCATEIQRIVRGHLAAIGVYDDIYRIMLVQAHVRGIIARQNAVDRMEKVLVLQGAARGFLTRFDICCQHGAATAIQARYRSYSAQLQFQFDIVDVIIVQSVVRRWGARNKFGFLLAVVRVQRAFRQWRSRSMRRERDQAAATKIQKSWRGFVSYMNYIFTIGDILMVQCIARKWLARRKVRTMSTEKRVNRGALVIQRNWRRYNAQMLVLYKLVHIIIVQSVARRYLATREVREMRLERWAAGTIQTWWRVESLKKAQHLDWAAVKIQAGWRRFWQYSHYIIVNFEVVRIQAVVRGFIARNESRLHLGCAIILQSIVRRYLAINAVRSYKIAQAVVMGAALSLREKHGAQRIQRGWLQWQQRRKEQKAALVIERFFVMVKVEVDREIKRRNKKKQSKRDRRRRQKKEADDKLLERVWLTTVDTKDTSRRSKSTPRSRHRRPDERLKRPHSKRDPSNRQSSPLRINPAPPTDAVNVRYPDDMSEVTSPSVFNRTGGFTNRQLGPRDMADNLSLEEAWIDTEVRQAKERKVMDDEYVQRHGLQNHGTYDLDNARFFGPDGREMAPSTARSSEVVGLNPLSPSSMSVQPDKRSPKENKHHDVQPQGPPHAPQQQQYSVRRPLYDKQVQGSPRFQPSSRGSSVRATSPHRPTKPAHDGGHLQPRTPGAKESHNTMGYPSPNNYRAPSPQNSNQYQGGLMQSPSQPSPSGRPSPQFHIMTSQVAQQVGQPIVQPMGQPEPTTRRLSQFNSGSSAVAPSDVTARMGNLVPNAATPRGMQQFHSMAATPQIPEVNHRTMGHTVTAPVPSPDMNHRTMGHTVTAPVPSPDMNHRTMGHTVTAPVPSPDMNHRTMGHTVTAPVPSPDMNHRTMGHTVTAPVPSPDMNHRTMGHTVTAPVPSPDMNHRNMNQFNLADSPSHGINQFHAVPSPVAQPEPVARSVNQFHPAPSPAAPEATPRVMGQFHTMQPPVVQTEASHRGMNQLHRAPSPIALSEHTPRSLRRAPSPTAHQSPTVRGFHSRPTPVSQSELDQLQVGTSPSGQPESILRGPTQFHSQGQPERARTPNRFQNVSVPGFSSDRSASQFQSQSVSNPGTATDLPTPNQYRSFDSHGSHPSSRSERFVEQKFHSSPSRESYVENLQQSSSTLEASPRRREGTPGRSHPQVSLSLTKSDDRQPVREPIVRRQIEQAQKLFDNKSSPQRDQGNTKTTYFGRRPDITFSNTNASGKTPSSRDENPRYMDRQSGGTVYDVPSSSSYQAFDISARPVSNGRGRPGQDRIGQYR